MELTAHSRATGFGQSRQRRILAQHDPSGLRAVAGAASATSAAARRPPRKRAPRRRRGHPWPGRGMSPMRSRGALPTRQSLSRKALVHWARASHLPLRREFAVAGYSFAQRGRRVARPRPFADPRRLRGQASTGDARLAAAPVSLQLSVMLACRQFRNAGRMRSSGHPPQQRSSSSIPAAADRLQNRHGSSRQLAPAR